MCNTKVRRQLVDKHLRATNAESDSNCYFKFLSVWIYGIEVHTLHAVPMQQATSMNRRTQHYQLTVLSCANTLLTLFMMAFGRKKTSMRLWSTV
jgi:hypothetical protein